VVIYLSLTFVYGRTGIYSTRELLEYRNQIYSNISELKKINSMLARKLEPLNTMEQIRLKAREMGYLAGNEKKIFLEGLERQDIYHSSAP
jgi:cell division protein FtsB